MFHLRMAMRSLGRTRGLTAVMIGALALGIGTWYVQHQVFTFLTSKLPAAPRDVYLVALERGATPPRQSRRDISPLLPSIYLTPRDAQAVLAGGGERRQTITFGAPALLEPEGEPAETVRVRYATRDLFTLFDVPLAAGQPWTDAADAGLFGGSPLDEAVIDERLARRLFGTSAGALGRRVRVDGADVRVVGVVAARHRDRYHLYERLVTTADAVYLPLAHATAANAEADYQYPTTPGEIGSVTAWVELRTDAERRDFLRRAEAYLGAERASGRTMVPQTVALVSPRAWRAFFATGGTINLWPLLSGLCVVTCVVNLVRMLIVKFSGRRHDLGLLRAFGARRSAIVGQLLLEATLIGLVAGVLGLLVGLTMMQFAGEAVPRTAGTASLVSAGSALLTIGASIAAALIAALYPTWRLSRGAPAVQLRGA